MSKRKGTRAEHKSIALLESLGYRVTRAAGSLGVWDLIGIGDLDIVLVQVKCNRPAGPAERKAMQEFKAPHNALKLQHVWYDRVRKPDVACCIGDEWIWQPLN